MDREEPIEPLRCETCGTLAVGRGDVRCCEGPMARIDGPATAAVSGPTLAELLRTVFGMSETELEVCLCVMEGGDLTAAELADRVGYDRSVVSRHLNHLAELGVIDKQRRILKQGGHTYAYRPVDPETVRKRLTEAFVAWIGEGTERLWTLRREKVESIAATDEEPAWKVFRDA